MQISQFVLYHGSDTNVKLPVWNLGSRYHQLVTRPHLQEEGSLFICELLEKELAEGK